MLQLAERWVTAHRHPSVWLSALPVVIKTIFFTSSPPSTALILLLGVPQSLIIWFSTTALLCDQSHSSHLSIFTAPSNEVQPLLPHSSSLITVYFIPASLLHVSPPVWGLIIFQVCPTAPAFSSTLPAREHPWQCLHIPADLPATGLLSFYHCCFPNQPISPA